MIPHITEKKIEGKLVRYCRERGLYCRKFTSPANRGVPDRVIAGHGRVLFLELKRPGNKLTALQQHEIAELRKHGVQAECATGWEEAKAIVDRVFPALSMVVFPGGNTPPAYLPVAYEGV